MTTETTQDITEELAKALGALVAQRDRPHGFPDPAWYEAEFNAARAALAAYEATKP